MSLSLGSPAEELACVLRPEGAVGTQSRGCPRRGGAGGKAWVITSAHTHSLHMRWAKICFFVLFLFVCGGAVRLEGPQFPEQGRNWGRGRKSPES